MRSLQRSLRTVIAPPHHYFLPGKVGGEQNPSLLRESLIVPSDLMLQDSNLQKIIYKYSFPNYYFKLLENVKTYNILGFGFFYQQLKF